MLHTRIVEPYSRIDQSNKEAHFDIIYQFSSNFFLLNAKVLPINSQILSPNSIKNKGYV